MDVFRLNPNGGAAGQSEACNVMRDCVTHMGDSLKRLCVLSQGKAVRLSQMALETLRDGQRIAFLELFSGRMMLTLGVRARGLTAPRGWDSFIPYGDA